MKETLRLLAVDDDPTFRHYLQEVLGGFCQLQMAVDGENALITLNHFKPHIILLDTVLPGISGLEVSRRIRLSKKLNSTVIIFTSACARTEDIKNGFRAGANAYLTKPFHHERLIILIEQCYQSILASQSPGLLSIDRPGLLQTEYKCLAQ